MGLYKPIKQTLLEKESNMETLGKLGIEAARKFLARHKDQEVIDENFASGDFAA